ncbi:MAG: Gfo/Idh/MocA family protein [Planctomycetota bacterium]
MAARDAAKLEGFAARFGWERTTTDWRDIVADPEVEVVDVATPNFLHRDPAVAALEAGKHVLCEKPLAGTLDDARAMRDAAAAANGQAYVWHNYRRCPAVATAWKLIQEGRLGRIFHVRATYLQDWGGPDTPMSWRFDKEQAGSGSHGDLNAHLIDLARFLTGDEIVEIHGATSRRWIEERVDAGTGEKRATSVDDALLFTAGFASGAVASFEASRLAYPHQNANNGEKGSVRFDFEDMNLLHFADASDGPRDGGWRRIMCTHAGSHPYAEHWWPDAHLIGYEHTFTNLLLDALRAIDGGEPAAWETQRVLEASLRAVEERRAVSLAEVE